MLEVSVVVGGLIGIGLIWFIWNRMKLNAISKLVKKGIIRQESVDYLIQPRGEVIETDPSEEDKSSMGYYHGLSEKDD